jgi:hypothetical protein
VHTPDEHESHNKPASVREGYEVTDVSAQGILVMPTYQGQISEEGLIDLVEYIKQLNSNYRIQQTLNTSQVQSQVQTSTSGPAQHTAATAPGMVKP